MKEIPIQIGTPPLFGIATLPMSEEPATRLPGVLLLNAGRTYRIGPNRFYVELARTVARAGLITFRFDFSGVGDSPAREDGRPLVKRWVEETRMAMDCLGQRFSIQRFLPIGLCSGAVVAFEAAMVDDRVAAVAAVNPEFHRMYGTAADYFRNRSLARAYTRAIVNPASWWRLVRGKSDALNLTRAVRFVVSRLISPKLRATETENRLSEQLAALLRRDVRLLLVHGDLEPGHDALSTSLRSKMRFLKRDSRARLVLIRNSDHMFTPLADQDRLAAEIQAWLSEVVPLHHRGAFPSLHHRPPA